VDTERALGLLRKEGYTFVQNPVRASVLLVNTCGFIPAAKEESIDAIMEMAAIKNKNPERLLVVTGCLAQRYEQALMQQIPEIDILLGVNRYETLTRKIGEALNGQRVSDCRASDVFWEHERVLTTPDYTCYHKIGEGCDNQCAYCAIPLIRGAYRSRPQEAILNEMTSLAQAGVREHILIAQDTTRYGTDSHGESRLPQLMEKAAAIQGVAWLRVLYCYPDRTDERLLRVMADHDNICGYLDMPLQHSQERILRKMRRRGSIDQSCRILDKAREAGFALRTTVMVGFPGETDQDFDGLLRFVKERAFNHLGAFMFCPEEGTDAAEMDGQIPEEVKRERFDILMRTQAAIALAANQQRVGSVCKVMVTGQDGNGMYTGRSAHEAPECDGLIRFTCSSVLQTGTFLPVRMTGADAYDYQGVAV